MKVDDNNPLRVETDIEDDDPLDPHPCLSPATPAESFFLSPHLRTNNVSAFALAQQLRTSSRGGTTTVATDDFQSAFDNEGDMQDNNYTYATTSAGSNSNHDSLFGKDILVLSRSVIPEDDRFEETMSAPNTPSGSTTSNQDVNAAQVVYSKAKDVWIWGKGLPVVGFFEGVTESVVSKVVSIAGTSMSDIDGAVQNVVSSLDTSYLNPAIAAVVDAIMKGVGKADSTFRPMIESVAPSVLGISKPTESKASTEAPELTTAPVTKVN